MSFTLPPDTLFAPADAPGVPLHPVTPATLADRLAALGGPAAAWAETSRFKGEPGQALRLPGPDGRLAGVLLGVAAPSDPYPWGVLPRELPAGTYRLEGATPEQGEAAALGWGLGAYQFTRYRARPPVEARLAWPAGADRRRVEATLAATWLVRDLVNTPAEDLGPADLCAAAIEALSPFGVESRQWVGDELLGDRFGLIHAVGRAAARPPRLLELTWGSAGAPKLTLVGKGVCFDTGGLDLKTADGMLLMKKDMGGAAHAIGLARMVAALGLPVRLRVLIPAVENAVAGNAFRPKDVLRSRAGLSVEVGNTDAEGRLILADALALALEEAPDLICDFATLTGAARVALGPDLPALFTRDDALAEALADAGRRTHDPLWRLPLWQPYARDLESGVADLGSVGKGPMAGAILGALFLARFVPAERAWTHLDVFSWNSGARPGRPEGGEAQTLRAFFAVLERRYGVTQGAPA